MKKRLEVVVVGHEVLCHSIALTGKSTTIGQKPEMVGGTLAIPEDFEPKFDFVRDEDLAKKYGGW